MAKFGFAARLRWRCCCRMIAQAQEARAGKSIPVKAGAGTLNKSGKTKPLKAGAGTGVMKRDGKAKLDPAYDPAQASRKAGVDDAPPTPGQPPPVPTPSDRGKGAASNEKMDGEKNIDDTVKIVSNFDRDVKCKTLLTNAKVTLDFQDAPIESITKLVSCWTNRNFIIATQKKGGKITILSPQPVSVYEAYRAFLSSLMVNGMSVTQKGAFYHIVDTADARSSGANVLGPKSAVPQDDNIVTRLIRLKNLDAKEVEPLVTKFKSKAGDVLSTSRITQ